MSMDTVTATQAAGRNETMPVVAGVGRNLR